MSAFGEDEVEEFGVAGYDERVVLYRGFALGIT
jgi:hypothetical protein